MQQHAHPPAAERLSKKVSIFKNTYATEPIKALPVRYVLDDIKKGKHRKWIEKLRKIFAAEGKSENYQKEKRKSVAVTFGGTFKARNKESLIEHSGLVIGDLDHVADLLIVKALLCGDRYVLACFISPSYDGLKLLIAIPYVTSDSEYKTYLEAIRKYYLENYRIDIKFPHDGKDICRLCYVSYDPDLYINPEAEVFTEREAPAEETTPAGQGLATDPAPAPAAPGGNGDRYKALAIDNILNLVNQSYPPGRDGSPGNRHYSRRNAAFLAGGYVAGGILAEGEILPPLLDAVKSNTDKETPAVKTVMDAFKAGQERPITREIKQAERDAWLTENGYIVTAHKNGRPAAADNLDPDTGAGSAEKHIQFWYWQKINKKGDLELKIDRLKFIAFLKKNGYAKTELTDKEYVFIHIRDNVIRERRPYQIKDYVRTYLQGLNHPDAREVQATIVKGARAYFSTDFLEFLPTIKPTFHKSDKDTAFFYFRNCAARVTRSGVEKIPYSDINGLIWERQILDRDFELADFDNCEFERFIDSVTKYPNDNGRKDSFTSAIGYLLHRYKNKAMAKAVICVDEKIPADDREANGGTGKGIFFNAISKLKNSVTTPGATFRSDKNFLYQEVNFDTEILIIDDVKKYFPLNTIFSTITEDLSVEKKNRQTFNIPFEDSPKIIITTNHTIQGRGASYDRRKFELEFSDHYSEKFTPYDDFGHTLFADWSREEWIKFDNFMLKCCQLYLHAGLVEYKKINLEKRTLIDSTHPDFVEFAEESIQPGQIEKKELFDKFIALYPEYENGREMITQRRFNNWVRYYALFNGWGYDGTYKSNSQSYHTIDPT